MESNTMTKICAMRDASRLAHVQSPTLAAKPWTDQGTGVESRMVEIVMDRAGFIGGYDARTPIFANAPVPRPERPLVS